MTHVSYATPPNHALDNRSRLERITDEFRTGYRLLETVERGVTYFGSTRATHDSTEYLAARSLARSLAEFGFTTVTGGGPGIMEAVNRGAVEGKGRSVGFNIMLETEQRNTYVQESVSFYYLFVRKVMLASAGHAYVFFPGGFGTLDEFFEISTLIHTHKLHNDVPVVLFGKAYWEPLLSYLKEVVAGTYSAFNVEDFQMWIVLDTVPETAAFIRERMADIRLYERYHRER